MVYIFEINFSFKLFVSSIILFVSSFELLWGIADLEVPRLEEEKPWMALACLGWINQIIASSSISFIGA